MVASTSGLTQRKLKNLHEIQAIKKPTHSAKHSPMQALLFLRLDVFIFPARKQLVQEKQRTLKLRHSCTSCMATQLKLISFGGSLLINPN